MGSDPGVRSLLIFALSVLLAGCARAKIVPTAIQPAAQAPIAPPLEMVPLGEELEYEVSWWGVPVGAVTFSITAAEKKLVNLTCRGRSNRYLEAFYPVRVEMISLIDPTTRSPRRFQASIKRHWRVHESVITFDPSRGTAFHELPKKRTATVPIGPATQDGLSLLYYVRTIPFEIGQKIPLEVSADGKNWHLTGRILKTSRVELKGVGSWPAVEGEVQLTYPVPFFQGAKVHLWFSADGQRIPLLAKIHSRIGPVTVLLTRCSKN